MAWQFLPSIVYNNIPDPASSACIPRSISLGDQLRPRDAVSFKHRQKLIGEVSRGCLFCTLKFFSRIYQIQDQRSYVKAAASKYHTWLLSSLPSSWFWRMLILKTSPVVEHRAPQTIMCVQITRRLVQKQILTQEVWAGAWDAAFLANS